MAGIFKVQYTRGGVKHLSSKWYVKYRDASGVIRRVPGFANRLKTEALAKELERKPRTRSYATALAAFAV